MQKALWIFLAAGFVAHGAGARSELPHRVVERLVDSGLHDGTPGATQARRVFRHDLQIEGATWLRVELDDFHLGESSYLIVKSMQDGEEQRFDAALLEHWNRGTAFFNGDTVALLLYAAPGDRGVFFRTRRVLAGLAGVTREETEAAGPQVVLGTDERVPSANPATARTATVGCTAWLISNGAFLTAGHCVLPHGTTGTCPTTLNSGFTAVQFDVPLSSSTGATRNPPTQDQYPVLTQNVQCEKDDDGDWAVFGVGTNSLGEVPADNQKGFFRVVSLADLPPANTSQVRVTGYGTDGPPPDYGHQSAPRNQYSQTQQTASGQFLGLAADGRYHYTTDTMGGDSGSPVTINGSQLAIGIHVIGNSNGGYNGATPFQLDALAEALQAFPGRTLSPAVPPMQTYHVDAEATSWTTPDGNVFSPYPSFTQAVGEVAGLSSGTAALIPIVAGCYPEQIDQTSGDLLDITVELPGDLTVQMPVGDVTIWGQALGDPSTCLAVDTLDS